MRYDMKGGGFEKCLTKPQVEDTIKRTLKIRNALLPPCVNIAGSGRQFYVRVSVDYCHHATLPLATVPSFTITSPPSALFPPIAFDGWAGRAISVNGSESIAAHFRAIKLDRGPNWARSRPNGSRIERQ
ncbi:hypothetical protein PV326_001363 [Microctonus aethiopoides]|nr:hypothetical protein PV326_001363 [Microctonus aethiopoides]